MVVFVWLRCHAVLVMLPYNLPFPDKRSDKMIILSYLRLMLSFRFSSLREVSTKGANSRTQPPTGARRLMAGLELFRPGGVSVTINDLHSAYGTIFPTGNRNAACCEPPVVVICHAEVLSHEQGELPHAVHRLLPRLRIAGAALRVQHLPLLAAWRPTGVTTHRRHAAPLLRAVRVRHSRHDPRRRQDRAARGRRARVHLRCHR